MKKFSVITIVLNDLSGIKRTARSVQGQTYKDFEWIVIDGGSTDGTREYIEALPVQPDYWVSEPDGGVYCAINKGVRRASGEYVICMNAGDVFHSEKVLGKVAERRLVADVVYGDWIRSRSTGDEFCAAPGSLPDFYFFNNNICHQAMFVKTTVLQKSGYDERYKIFADWARWRHLSMEGGTFQHLPIVVCDFEAETGLSSCNGALQDREIEMMSTEFPKSVQEANERARKRFPYRFRMMESLVYQWIGRIWCHCVKRVRIQRRAESARVWYLTFADSRMAEVHRRLRKQTAKMKIFGDRVRICTENDLAKEFRAKMKDRMIPGSRGFGFWCWKPQIILQLLLEVQEGDVVMYVDAGCHLNPKGVNRIFDYCDLARKYDLVAFQARAKGEKARTDMACHFWLEKEWTKMDLVRHFGVESRQEILDSGQCEAVVIVVRRCERTIRFYTQLRDMFINHFNLCDDTPSETPNHFSFKDHRFDQSVFSLMCKINGVYTLSNAEYAPIRNFMPDGGDERLWPERWRDLSKYPVWAKRDIGRFSHKKVECPDWLKPILGKQGRRMASELYEGAKRFVYKSKRR